MTWRDYPRSSGWGLGPVTSMLREEKCRFADSNNREGDVRTEADGWMRPPAKDP